MTKSSLSMTTEEFIFLCRRGHGLDEKRFLAIGEDCFEAGWIDDFGIVTPKGRNEIELYERINYG